MRMFSYLVSMAEEYGRINRGRPGDTFTANGRSKYLEAMLRHLIEPKDDRFNSRGSSALILQWSYVSVVFYSRFSASFFLNWDTSLNMSSHQFHLCSGATTLRINIDRSLH